MKILKVSILLMIVFLISCNEKKQKTYIKFVDEFVLKDSIVFKNTLIGGLSGIDYDGENFYFVVDDSEKPRILKSSFQFNEDTISEINFLDVIHLKDSSLFFKQNALDLESVIYDDKKSEFHLVSEGNIKQGKDPSIFKVNSKGSFVNNYPIPENLKTKAKHNASFESSTKNIDNTGTWVAVEGVLEEDGEEPGFTKTNSPIRFTFFDDIKRKATKQYAYMLDAIDKPKKGNINLNGVTAILSKTKNEFFVLERAYQSGYESYGNTVKLYRAIIDATTTNTLTTSSLKSNNFVPLKKELLLNLNTIKSQLTKGIIDNIEGITYGPLLKNGNKTLILVSDDNFQKYDKQINQFIVLEIQDKN